jgi:uncharacterized cupin superfamily protein
MPIAHSRDGFEETLYGLEGSDHLVFDGEQIEFRPGDTVCNRPILKRLRPSCSDTAPRLSSGTIEPLCRYVDFHRRLRHAVSELEETPRTGEGKPPSTASTLGRSSSWR